MTSAAAVTASIMLERELEDNITNKRGYIAVHDQKGIFLGCQGRKPVFSKIEDIDPEQPVPARPSLSDKFMTEGWQFNPFTKPDLYRLKYHPVPVEDTDIWVVKAKDVVSGNAIRTLPDQGNVRSGPSRGCALAAHASLAALTVLPTSLYATGTIAELLQHDFKQAALGAAWTAALGALSFGLLHLGVGVGRKAVQYQEPQTPVPG